MTRDEMNRSVDQTLDSQSMADRRAGGPFEPTQAQIDAALLANDQPYPPPLDELLRMGDPDELEDVEERIAELGLQPPHVPDLVRMARDRVLNQAENDSEEVWAPLHAVRALKNLDVGAASSELVYLLDIDDDWFKQELPEVFARAGAAAIEPLGAYLRDHERWIYGRMGAGEALTKIGVRHPDLRDRVVQILADELKQAAENDTGLNGFLVSDLVNLGAVEHLPLIRQVFEQDAVDETIRGDWSEVQRGLGIKPDPHDPLVRRSRERWDEERARMRAMLPPRMRGPDPYARPAKPDRETKAVRQKRKRKQSATSRKANKRKRK